MSGPVRERCQVLGQGRSGVYHTLTVAAPRVATASRAGQFLAVLPGTDHTFRLRRPFSVHRVGRSGGTPATVEFSFAVLGPGTQALAALREGEELDVLGPLGRPFRPPATPTACLLVGGGYGAAPLFLLSEELRARGCRVDLLTGAATAERLFKPAESAAVGDSLTITTDDGSAGRRGVVTDAMPALLASAGGTVVYACGPMAMLAAVARTAAAAGVACQVAVEEQMACGTGICFSCVVPLFDGAPGVTRMARTCIEGPVFDGAAVAWAELGLGELTP
ncbi:MAG TPA: dihydroorotate dehydrogenase electron transfer subunit [Actinomycetota bacterium]|nr:dihydroorotate dehydrogenase electron transfer subunit [Actinomycetota bacterium]